jgi:hypothetical protein
VHHSLAFAPCVALARDGLYLGCPHSEQRPSLRKLCFVHGAEVGKMPLGSRPLVRALQVTMQHAVPPRIPITVRNWLFPDDLRPV